MVYGTSPQCLVGELETQTNSLGRNRPLPPERGGAIIKIIYLWSYHSGINMAGSLQFVCSHCLAAEAMQYTLKCLVASFKKEPYSQALPPHPTHVSTLCLSDIITRDEISLSVFASIQLVSIVSRLVYSFRNVCNTRMEFILDSVACGWKKPQ